MEWDFTPSEVSIGKVAYTLEDFLKDLRIEIDTNLTKFNDEQRDQLCRLFYGVMYFKFNGRDDAEISKIFKIDPSLVKVISDLNKENLEMLAAIIMNLFLKNLEETDGFVSDTENIHMVNAQLKKFHKTHSL